MTLKEFWSYPEKIAIHCKTEEEAIKLLNAFDDFGKTWHYGQSYRQERYYFNGICYTNTGYQCELDFYLKAGVLILEFEEIEL